VPWAGGSVVVISHELTKYLVQKSLYQVVWDVEDWGFGVGRLGSPWRVRMVPGVWPDW